MSPKRDDQNSASVLGVILAGGQSRRFGSDKAAAILGGRTLLERAIAALDPYCDSVIVAGRKEAPVQTVPDWPQPGRGPLGGLAGALRHAVENGFPAILTCGVDSVGLPDDLMQLLSPAPAVLQSQPVVGHWPVSVLPELEAFIASDAKNAMWRFAEAVGANRVELNVAPANINCPADLENLQSSISE